MSVVARVRPTSTIEDARAEMDTIARGLQSQPRNENIVAEVVPLREELVGEFAAQVLVVYGAVIMLLAISGFNVANLVLARSMARTREVAVRASLGAGGAVIARQFMVEGAILAVAGGALGILVARWSLHALLTFVPSDVLPLGELQLDRRLVGYVTGISLLMGVALGLVPAVVVTRRSLAALLSSHSARTTSGSTLRHALVVGQVAMTVVLLCGAGLLVRTVAALASNSVGFTHKGVLTMQVALPQTRYDEQRRVEFFRQARERLRGVPGVSTTAAAFSLPVTGPPIGLYEHQPRR